MSNLTRDILTKLAEPFPSEKISFKIQTNPKGDSNVATIVAYIDARDVMDRLDAVVGGDWSDEYLPALTPKGLRCKLTVCGTSREDVGDSDNPTEPTKTAYSDALKRAAVKFGVGRFLYESPRLRAKCRQVGNNWYIEDGELHRLRGEMARFLSNYITAAEESQRTEIAEREAEAKKEKPALTAEQKAVASKDAGTLPGDPMKAKVAKNSFIGDEAKRKKFFAALKDNGLDQDVVKAWFNIESWYDFEGSGQDALKMALEYRAKLAQVEATEPVAA